VDQIDSRLKWRRSRRCANGSCVEYANDQEAAYIRDSKYADSPVLAFSHGAWRDFLVGIRLGEFD
jgi:hypothetical protein